MGPTVNYVYRALLISVYDGDTITVDVDLGYGVWMRGVKIRLSRINTPELRRPTLIAGRASRDHLQELLSNPEIIIKSTKKGKYGRWLAEVWNVDGVNVNDRMMRDGYAVTYT
jgi:micrococcal nuclease